jgi:hypothetical protein
MSLREDVQECIAAWQGVLAKYGVERKLRIAEIQSIERMVAREGKGFVLLAFLGAKNEPSREGFNPGDYVSLVRVFDPLKIERFVNLGARVRKQLAVRPAPVIGKIEPTNPEGTPSPEEVRKFIGGIIKSIR